MHICIMSFSVVNLTGLAVVVVATVSVVMVIVVEVVVEAAVARAGTSLLCVKAVTTIAFINATKTDNRKVTCFSAETIRTTAASVV